MIPAGLLVHAATWVAPGTDIDAYGNTVPDWDAATSTAIRCRVEQASRDETSDETRDALVSTWRLYANETGITGRDRVVALGLTFEVDGPPALVADGAGTHHLEATLRVVGG